MTVTEKELLNPEKERKAKSFKRAFDSVKDEYITPSCLVNILLPFLQIFRNEFILLNNREPIIWCPFDLSTSKYVEILKSNGFDVVHSHISEGLDFFAYQPEKWDIVISNPPFSKKLAIFKRLVQFSKPFVLLMNMMALNYQEIGEFFAEVGKSIQFLIPDKKVSFDGKTSSFCSGYVCYKFLDRTEFVHLDNNNTGKNFSQ